LSKENWGYPKYRDYQVWKWIRDGVITVDGMTEDERKRIWIDDCGIGNDWLHPWGPVTQFAGLAEQPPMGRSEATSPEEHAGN